LFSDCILLATPEKSFFQSTPDKLKVKILEPLGNVDIQEDEEQHGQQSMILINKYNWFIS
jgi:hypothetical protein